MEKQNRFANKDWPVFLVDILIYLLKTLLGSDKIKNSTATFKTRLK